MLDFKKMKIQEKLQKGFTLVCLIACLSGLISILGIIVINVQYQSALKDYGFAQGDIGKALVMVTDSRRAIRDIVNFTHEDDVANAKTQLEEIRQKHDNYRTDVEKSIKNARAKELWAAVNTALESYRTIQDEIVSEGEVIESDEERVELNERMISEMDPAYDALYSAYAELLTAKTDVGNTRANSLVVMGIILSVVGVILILVALYQGKNIGNRIAVSIAGPLAKCVERFELLAKGDFTSPVPEVETRDEVKQMVDSMSIFTEKTSALIKDLNRGLAEMASGNFNIAPEVEYPGDFEGIMNSLAGFIVKISVALKKINDTASDVSGGAEQIAQGAQVHI